MELPDDIVEEIVRRLPGKSMLQFRRVSKSWRCMIDSFKFKPHVILVDRRTSIAFQSSTDNYTNDIDFEELTTPFPSTAQVNIKGSVNGLLLLSVEGFDFGYDDGSIFIWNPFTGYMTNIPKIFYPEKHWLKGVGFSYNPHTDDYTVVVAVTELSYHEDYSCVMAASLKTMEWSRVRFDGYDIGSICDDDGVVVEGHLHWRVKKIKKAYNNIVYFDAITSEFQEVPLPVLGEGVIIDRLCVLRGCLSIICIKFSVPGIVQIKAMTKYGDAESWTTLISLSRSNLRSSISFLPLYFMTHGEEVLIQIDEEIYNEKIVAYNLRYNSIRTIGIPRVQSLGWRYILVATSFEPTLIKPVLILTGNLKNRKSRVKLDNSYRLIR